MTRIQQTPAPLNEADGLRAQLAACERDVTSPTIVNVRGIFKLLAAAEQTFAAVQAHGADMRPEAARIETLHERIARDGAKLVKLLGGTAAYVELRGALQPASDGPAWQLDRMLAERRQRRLRSMTFLVVLLAALGGAMWVFRDVLLPPDPIGDIADSAQRVLLEGGSPQAALTQIDAGLVISPASSLLLTWRSALLDGIDPDASRAAADRAAQLIGKRQFLLDRAVLFVQIDRPQAVLVDADALIALDPTVPEAYYLRASGYELLGKSDLAMVDLQKCADLAEQQGNAALFANARIRLGNLMQRGGL
jgi:hypothetical protein